MRPALPRLLLASLALLASPAQAQRVVLVTLDGAPLDGLDRLPAPKDRLAIVDKWLLALKKHKVPALVFAPGDRLASTGPLLKRWAAAGHEFGTLGQRLDVRPATPIDPWKQNLTAGRDGLTAALRTHGAAQKTVRWYRFPDLVEGAQLDAQLAAKDAIAKASLRLVDATIDTVSGDMNAAWLAARTRKDKVGQAEATQDWLAAMRAIVARSESIADRLKIGDAPQVLRLSLDALGAENADALFAWLVRRGYRFAKADDVLSHPLFLKTHAYTGRRGVSLLWRLRISKDLENADKQIHAILQQASESWSRGDLDAFMTAFTEDMRFVSGRSIIEGRLALRNAYRARYKTPASMGKLTLNIERLDIHTSERETLFGLVEPVPPRYALAAVSWSLAAKGGPTRTGHASLVLLKTTSGWRIYEDHSTTGTVTVPERKRPPRPR